MMNGAVQRPPSSLLRPRPRPSRSPRSGSRCGRAQRVGVQHQLARRGVALDLVDDGAHRVDGAAADAALERLDQQRRLLQLALAVSLDALVQQEHAEVEGMLSKPHACTMRAPLATAVSWLRSMEPRMNGTSPVRSQ
jgi:hypothetical protein